MSGADHSAPRTVTRGEIADLAGVRRPAVSNWARRYPDFPKPAVPGGGSFAAAEVAVWLDSRTIPADARLPGEPAGTTYGTRFRARLAQRGTPLSATDPVEHAAAQLLRESRWLLDMGYRAEQVTVPLVLLYLSEREPSLWRELREGLPAGGTVLEAVQEALRRFDPDESPPLARLAHSAQARRNLRGLSDTVEYLRGRKLLSGGDLFTAVVEKFSEPPLSYGDLTTPRSVVQVMAQAVDVPSPAARVYDPFCRMGELLVAVADRVRRERSGAEMPVVGRALHQGDPLIPGMNLAVHRVEADLERVSRTPVPGRAGQRFDIVVTNPPFNADPRNAWLGADDPPYGSPPRHNANFGWLQRAVTALAPEGSAAVLMANNAAFSANPAEQAIRAAMVADRTVECLITLPGRLYASTGIGVTVWLLRPPGKAGDEVLFIDARSRGVEVSRTRRALTEGDVAEIVGEVRSWRNSVRNDVPYPAKLGFSRAVPLTELLGDGCVLHPPARVGPPPAPQTHGDGPDRLAALQRRLRELADRSERVDAEIADLLEGTD